MTHEELNCLIRDPLLRGRSSAIDVLKRYGWLLIPDVRVDLLRWVIKDFFTASGSMRRPKWTSPYERWQGRLHWQFVQVASPSARIIEGSQPSAEFQHSLEQVDGWRRLIRQNGIPGHLLRRRLDGVRLRISYRIIGQSQRQSSEEQALVRQSRENDLRIRSFNWLLEKPVHYSKRELELLAECGVPIDGGQQT
ncbi:MAG: hypothetical protein R3C05_11060 [Pirellulaceae bacterium]